MGYVGTTPPWLALYATFHILVSAEESLIGLVKMQILILTKA